MKSSNKSLLYFNEEKSIFSSLRDYFFLIDFAILDM
jgi:hypothetical protein